MKKTLVAMAALAATGAFAQVTMYGSIDVAYGAKTHTDANGNTITKATGVMEGLNAGNRIGFRGTEDLGSGLKANFVIENGINITNGQLFSTRAGAAGQQIDGVAASGNMPAGAYTTSTNRQSYVALESATLGQVRLGYQYTNLYQLSTLSGYMNGAEQPGSDIAHTLSNANFGGTRANAITYISPRFSGVQVTLQHGAGTGRELVESNSTTAADATAVRNSLMFNYNGVQNLDVSYAYTSYMSRTNAVAVGALTNVFGVTNATAVTNGDTNAKLHQLGASYNFGVAKLTATYNNGKEDAGGATGALTTTNFRSQQIGIEGLFGAFRPYAQIGGGKVENDATGLASGDYKTQQFGVRYDLSKRTTAYFMTGTSKDDAAVTTGLAKREVTALGLYHSF
jgi:predicted porin